MKIKPQNKNISHLEELEKMIDKVRKLDQEIDEIKKNKKIFVGDIHLNLNSFNNKKIEPQRIIGLKQ